MTLSTSDVVFLGSVLAILFSILYVCLGFYFRNVHWHLDEIQREMRTPYLRCLKCNQRHWPTADCPED